MGTNRDKIKKQNDGSMWKKPPRKKKAAAKAQDSSKKSAKDGKSGKGSGSKDKQKGKQKAKQKGKKGRWLLSPRRKTCPKSKQRTRGKSSPARTTPAHGMQNWVILHPSLARANATKSRIKRARSSSFLMKQKKKWLY